MWRVQKGKKRLDARGCSSAYGPVAGRKYTWDWPRVQGHHRREKVLKTRYWPESDDLYIYLRDFIEDGEAVWQVPFDYEYAELGGIVADLSQDGKILGFEVGDAQRRLPWPDDAGSLGPQVSESYDRQANEYALSFGAGGVRTIVVTDRMFPTFSVSIELDQHGKVTQLKIPNASLQFRGPP